MSILTAQTIRAAAAVVAALADPVVYRATKYLSPGLTVVATRKRFHGKLFPAKYTADIHLTIGRPNYVSRVFIRDCVADGEKFPVRRVQLQRCPVPRS